MPSRPSKWTRLKFVLNLDEEDRTLCRLCFEGKGVNRRDGKIQKKLSPRFSEIRRRCERDFSPLFGLLKDSDEEFPATQQKNTSQIAHRIPEHAPTGKMSVYAVAGVQGVYVSL
uniref:Uncharacterized protein n=1 Tax=Toxoplasma gondii TgCATBr9 TaxID=943120 RepID=A0A2T6IYT4_TOXGO|nr:hypothetical protein TGBR9_246450B [Toxoplasma gondii TgCATBr9]